jgi:ATP-dependent exoDNAse (exonuclease V) alpha subunit
MNPDQQHALEVVQNGRNAFLTGPGGVGKSFTISEIKKWAYSANKKTAITATTGSAAFIIGGKTIHSYLGIGLAKEEIEVLIRIVCRKTKIANQLRKLDILIIDEVSMLSDELISKIAKLLSAVRNNPAPFGGVQMIFVGDMCQLPPVIGNFAFHSSEWKSGMIEICNLTINMRQKDDPVFLDLLERLRFGKSTKADYNFLKNLQNTEFPTGIKPTRLFPINADVDRINSAELQKLQTSISKYKVEPDPNDINASMAWFKSAAIPEELQLCVGAQVVLLVNLNHEIGLVNGARGTVLSLYDNYAYVSFSSGININIEYKTTLIDNSGKSLSIAYLPLKLAWALSIHRCQGMTLDAIEIDIGTNIFSPGQAYTGLSRAKNSKSVKITKIDAKSLSCSKVVIAFYTKK